MRLALIAHDNKKVTSRPERSMRCSSSSTRLSAQFRDHGLAYPIALDNDFATWRAPGNDAWPAKYLFDAQGRLVKRWVGEA